RPTEHPGKLRPDDGGEPTTAFRLTEPGERAALLGPGLCPSTGPVANPAVGTALPPGGRPRRDADVRRGAGWSERRSRSTAVGQPDRHHNVLVPGEGRSEQGQGVG